MTGIGSEIESELAVLIGRPLWGSSRAADMEMFAFGERRLGTDLRGRPVERGEFALHVQCPWRIVHHGGILAGSRDVYSPREDAQEVPADFDWDQPSANRRDQRLQWFFEERAEEPSVVQSIEADDVGSLRILLSGDFVLDVFPADSLDEEGHSERWRFFRPGTDTPHIVVTGRGLEQES